jgi:hypothetical protein
MDKTVETQLKELDKYLQEFKDYEHGYSKFTFWEKFWKDETAYYSEAIINKFDEDGLIYYTTNGTYFLSIKGRIFEGYYQKRINDEMENNRLKNLEIHQIRHQSYMTRLTALLVMIGLVTVIWYSIEIYKFVYSYLHHFE